MKVTCMMPTYGRASQDMFCLQEAVYWFTRQILPAGVEAELLIMNDAPGQVLRCDTPGVRVINFPARFPTLGDKYNGMVREAAGELLLPWEDDDISLPGRIAQAVGLWADNFVYWNPKRSFFEEARKLMKHHKQGVNHNASAIRRSFALEHPYPSTNKQDSAFDAVAYPHGIKLTLEDPRQWQYIYRWGHTSTGHLSGHSDVARAYDNWTTPVPGEYLIEPRMHRDYVKDVAALLAEPAPPVMDPAKLPEGIKTRPVRLSGYDIDGVATRGVRPQKGQAAIYISARQTDAFARTVSELGSDHPIYLRPMAMGPAGSHDQAVSWKAMMLNLHGVDEFFEDDAAVAAALRERCPNCRIRFVKDGVVVS